MKPQALIPRQTSTESLIATVLFTLSLFAAPVLAADDATLKVTPSALVLETSGAYHSLSLIVGGPHGKAYRQTIENTQSLSFGLFDEEGNTRPDGLYSYQLRGRTKNHKVHLRRVEEDLPLVRTTLLAAGFFTLAGGHFVSPETLEGQDLEKLILNEDLEVAGDLIVRGDTCLGRDCNAEIYYGRYGVRLRENNTRLMFEDTSSSANFPTNDWALVANDVINGGANYFSIQDCGASGCSDSDKKPFTILSGAPESAFLVDGDGKLGLGTAAPEEKLHTVHGDTPALRLEQDGSVGFAEQSWDIAGNEANFFVRDHTNGLTLPFRIRPGAPTSSIDIAADGNVGIGIDRPKARLDVDGDIALTGTVDGRNVEADGQTLDAHLEAENPHGIHPLMIGAEEAGTAFALVAAHEAAYDHSGLGSESVKAGIAQSTAFTGDPATAVVTFATPFPPSTVYALSLTVGTIDNSRLLIANAGDLSEDGFSIFLDSGINNLIRVDWVARRVTQ